MEVANELLEALILILPMAKGYAYEHQVGSNVKYIEIATQAILNAEEFNKLFNAYLLRKTKECCKYSVISHGIGLSGEVEEIKVHCKMNPENDHTESIAVTEYKDRLFMANGLNNIYKLNPAGGEDKKRTFPDRVYGYTLYELKQIINYAKQHNFKPK
jgi:hypothetical protein